MVQMLLDRGSGLDARDSTYGHTPLSLVAMNGHDDIVKLLLRTDKIGADVKDNCGRTPLSFAARYGHHTVAKTILIRSNRIEEMCVDAGIRLGIFHLIRRT